MTAHANQLTRPTQAMLTRRAALSLLAGGGTALALAACKKDSPGAASDASEPAPPAEAAVVGLQRPSLFALATLPDEQNPTPSCPDVPVESGLANVDVPSDLYLNEDQIALLEQFGFYVDGDGWGSEFYPIYEENRYLHRANFVTVDSMMHTYHLYFQYLLKGLEREALSNSLYDLSQRMLDASLAQFDPLAGTEWESAAMRCVAFFGVAARLLDPNAAIPDPVALFVDEEVSRIEQAAGAQQSVVTEENLDYTQFEPRSYYAGDETLERYFRTMMWYGQVSYFQRSEELDRSALLTTLALQGDALSLWESIYAVTSFFAGASDDCGYYEYRPVIDKAYGEAVTAADLPGNDAAWQAYRELTAQMPAPQINSLAGGDAQNLAENKGFRFMGQRFTVDSAMFQQLIYSNVGDAADGSRRLLPDALDIPAAFGSDAALAILDQQGDTAYPNYPEQMQQIRGRVAATGDTFWQASLYNQWICTLRPLLDGKGDGYPAFMRSEQWTRKALESFLGSYTELKHDTVLYSKQALAEGDGPIPEDRDDRGWVEPEPLVLSRLQRLCAATSQGLDHMGMINQTQIEDLAILEQLAGQLATIASKELAGELPTDDEFELIRSIGVQLEHFWEQAYTEEAERSGTYLDTRQFPAPLVVDVASGGDSCLELATGRVRTMYVIVPVDGALRVASGPVFSFYQFGWPAADRLTDVAWRELLQNSWITPTEETTPEHWTLDYLYQRER